MASGEGERAAAAAAGGGNAKDSTTAATHSAAAARAGRMASTKRTAALGKRMERERSLQSA